MMNHLFHACHRRLSLFVIDEPQKRWQRNGRQVGWKINQRASSDPIFDESQVALVPTIIIIIAHK